MADDTNGAAVDELIGDALKHTVQVAPPGQGAFSHETGIWFVRQLADEIEAWGGNVKLRDRQLRESILIDPMFASALATVCSRNAAFSYQLQGEEQDVAEVQDILQTANFGKGWADFILKTCIDLYTQDSGAFWEIMRYEDSPEAPLAGIANLDASRCFHTGLPRTPVVYVDRNNKYHTLKWYQVATITEMPMPYEGIPGLQICAFSRLLREVQIARDTGIYLKEKIGGRNTRAITAVKGVSADQIDEALQKSSFANDARGLLRYSGPTIVSSVSPDADIGFETLELASIPDGFSLEERNKWYIALIAMAFLSDYQEFAPLPGGGLGTASQSETQAQKTRGKGPALFQKTIEQTFNYLILPPNVEFTYAQQDLDQETAEALAAKTRAEERQLRITAGEISVEIAQMRALDSGDLTQEQYDEQQSQNEEMKQQAEEERMASIEAMNLANEGKRAENSLMGQSRLDDTGTPGAQNSRGDNNVEQKAADDRAGASESSRLSVEQEVEDAMDGAFDVLYAKLLKRNGVTDAVPSN